MPLVQLEPHLFSSLPAHPSLPSNPDRPQLQSFIRDALLETLDVLSAVPSGFTMDPKVRASPPCSVPVTLYRGHFEPRKSKPDFWVCRETEHTDWAVRGTASWDEFQDGLRSNHAEHEMEYTPSITGLERLIEWSKDEIGELELDGVPFKDVGAEVNLITHTFKPAFLISPRSFITLTITAEYDSYPTRTPAQQVEYPANVSFITAQIPLRLPDTPTDLRERILAAVPRKTIFANYASVERVTLLQPSPFGSGTHRRVRWTMATTSNAGGLIPQWVQRSWTLGGVPRAIAADVGLFIGWVMKRRNEEQMRREDFPAN